MRKNRHARQLASLRREVKSLHERFAENDPRAAKNELAVTPADLSVGATPSPVAPPAVAKSGGGTMGARSVLQLEMQAMAFSGPLPHPTILQGYEQIVPGAAKQILDDAHGQTAHRQALERFAIKMETVRSFAGMGVGAILEGIALYVSYRIAELNPAAGAAFGGATVAMLAGVFVTGAVTKMRERKDKAAFMAEALAPVRKDETKK